MNKRLFYYPVLLLAAVVGGQLLRFDIIKTPRVTILGLDIAMGLLLVIFLFLLLCKREFTFFLKKTWAVLPWRFLLLFILWALVSFVLNFSKYSTADSLTTFSYWIRLMAASSMAFFTTYYFQSVSKKSDRFFNYFLIAGSITVIAGFVQLIFIPSFSFMTKYGWDPHSGRLLSTFFDPNYYGVFLILIMSLALVEVLKRKLTKLNIYQLVLVLSWVALYFTYSRSSWVSGLIGLTLVALSKSWKHALVIAAIFVAVLFLPSRLGQRISQTSTIINKSAVTSEVTQNESGSVDMSGAARIASFKRALQLGSKSWIYGVGYNAFGPAMAYYKIVDTEQYGHSSQGSDSSIMNAFVTTGIVGLIIFLGFILFLWSSFYQDWRQLKTGAALFGFIPSWVAGSFLNNSLFYMLILVPVLLLSALIISASLKEKKKEV